ncbi:MAG: helix-turn-helix domain-containing protein [Acidimicrobiaceae bacterium]|nr:helix-turn-helix domain-containing protein [Acidimicrobiaceae bacterium]
MSELTTDGLSVSEREGFWRQAMSETFVPLMVGETSGDSLRGSIRSYWLGRLMVAQLASTAQDIQRTPKLISRSDTEYFQVAMVTGGVGRVTQDGRHAVLRPGDFAVYETTRPFEWAFDADWAASVFTFPRDSVRLAEPERRLLTARRLDGAAGMTGVISRFLQDLARNSALLSNSQSEPVLGHTTDLIVSLLSDCSEGSEVVRSSAQRSLVFKIKEYIDGRLADPMLSPAEVAAAANISVRYLHKLFAAEGYSVSEYVKRSRLERCRRDLLDPRLGERSISTIAYRWGFGDLSGFNRAFKAMFGVTPRDLRGGGRVVMGRRCASRAIG